jgi:hypothetical protein
LKNRHVRPQVHKANTVDVSRRDILGLCAGVVAASVLPSLASPVAFADPSIPGMDKEELAVAALGVYFSTQSPLEAAKLVAKARRAGALPVEGDLDLQQVRGARERLIAPARTHSELETADVVYVSGWLLTQSEIGAALLYGSLLTPGADAGEKR